MRGAFITIEGIEGVGKSTSLRLIERFLVDAGHSLVVTREPGGTPLGERIREWVLDTTHEDISRETETLLMFAARAHHLATVINPALARGQWVISDRFTDASLAYQGAGRGVSQDFLTCLVNSIQGDLRPDLTLLLDSPVQIGRQRISDRTLDRFEQEQDAFFERVRSAYLSLAEDSPERFVVVDASQPRSAVDAQLEQSLRNFCERFDEHRG